MSERIAMEMVPVEQALSALCHHVTRGMGMLLPWPKKPISALKRRRASLWRPCPHYCDGPG